MSLNNNREQGQQEETRLFIYIAEIIPIFTATNLGNVAFANYR
jgi:hypothetical protein